MEYKINEDLENIRQFYGLTQSELAEELDIERVRLARTETGETTPRKELLDLVYGYAFSRGLKLNLQKEMFYKEEMEEAAKAICILGGRMTSVKEVELPGLDDRRAIIFIQKIKETPFEYPRKAGVPGKNPL